MLISQELTRGSPRLGDDADELVRLCGRHHSIPTSYKLEGVMRVGNHSQHISEVIEIWQGMYKDEVVALKVLKVSRQDPHHDGFKRVSMLHDPPAWVPLRCSDI